MAGYFTEHDFPNIDHHHGLNYCSSDQQTTETDNKDRVMDIFPLEGFFELDWASQFPYQSNELSSFDDLESFSHWFNNLPTLDEVDFGVDHKPLKIVVPQCDEGNASGFGTSCVKKEIDEEKKKVNQEMSLALPLTLASSSRVMKKSSSSSSSSSSRVLEFDEIKKHFGLKIADAAKEMNVGMTLLKRRCRELKIMRWPHRKLKSLNSLIDNVKEMGLGDELAKLENHRMMLESIPGMELSDKTKKLRQACFKAKYKRRKRCLGIQA